jgi:hypothetical protein
MRRASGIGIGLALVVLVIVAAVFQYLGFWAVLFTNAPSQPPPFYQYDPTFSNGTQFWNAIGPKYNPPYFGQNAVNSAPLGTVFPFASNSSFLCGHPGDTSPNTVFFCAVGQLLLAGFPQNHTVRSIQFLLGELNGLEGILHARIYTLTGASTLTAPNYPGLIQIGISNAVTTAGLPHYTLANSFPYTFTQCANIYLTCYQPAWTTFSFPQPVYIPAYTSVMFVLTLDVITRTGTSIYANTFPNLQNWGTVQAGVVNTAGVTAAGLSSPSTSIFYFVDNNNGVAWDQDSKFALLFQVYS